MAKAVELPFFIYGEALYGRATETEREVFIGGYCSCINVSSYSKLFVGHWSTQLLSTVHVHMTKKLYFLKYDLQKYVSFMLGSGKDRKAVHCSTVEIVEKNCEMSLTKFIPTLARNPETEADIY